MKSTKFSSLPVGSDFQIEIARWAFFFLAMLHAIVYFTIATDNNGDPNEYLAIARSLFTFNAPINPNRFIGYPLFVKLTSLNLAWLNFTFLVQHLIFLFCLWIFAKQITDSPLFRVLIYLPAFIPAVIYLPNLLFPDCLILSLLLLLGAELKNDRLLNSLMICLALILIKTVFVFLMILIVGNYVLKKKLLKGSLIVYGGVAAAITCLIPVVFIFSPFPLYQSVVQKPVFIMERAVSTKVPNPLEVICNGRSHEVVDAVVLARVTEHSSDLSFMPLGSNLARQLVCTPQEIKELQRSLIISFFWQDPWGQIRKFSTRYFRNTFNLIDVNHVGYMLMRKYYLLNSFYSFKQYYEPSQMEYFSGNQMSPLRLPSQVFLRILIAINEIYERSISYLIMAGVAVSIFASRKLKHSLPSSSVPILVLIFAYNFCITFFAFGYDRYIFINYFLWVAVIVMWAQAFQPLKRI